MKNKVVFDAGVTNTRVINNTFITGFEEPTASVPRSPKAKVETIAVKVTNKILEKVTSVDARLIKRV